jgi:hypothetical protein
LCFGSPEAIIADVIVDLIVEMIAAVIVERTT